MTYINGNKDDINIAITALSIFTHNWCMNCKKTEEKNKPMFNCLQCEFGLDDGTCLVKKFVVNHTENHKLPDDFGSMSR